MSSPNRSLLNDHRSLLEDHDFSFVASSPVVSHSHHFNLGFDQIIDDALGPVHGPQVRAESAYESCSLLLNGFISELPPTTLEERVEIAASMFASMGLGSLDFEIAADGSGTVIGRHMHYGYLWREQIGRVSERTRTDGGDAFAAEFIAATVEAAFGMPTGSIQCSETACIAKGDGDECRFELTPSKEDKEAFGVTRADILEVVPESFGALDEIQLTDIAGDLREFVVKATNADQRGLIASFGVYLTHHLANYYNLCANRMFDILAVERPFALDIARELLRDCGHRDGYFTFGGLLRSDEWKALSIEGSGPRQTIIGCLSIARAFGYGHWSLESYEPDQRLVLRSPSTYESSYRKVAHQDGETGCCFTYQGAAMSMMDLAHRVIPGKGPSLTASGYRRLRSGMPWKSSESHCVSAGHDMCRVIIERA